MAPIIPGKTPITQLTGPFLITLILNWGLFGALSIQVYLYSQMFPDDALRLKLLVYGVYILETIQTVLVTETGWSYFASGFGNLHSIDLIGTTWISVCVLGGVVACIVQLFYAYRIYTISNKRYVSYVIVFISTLSLISAIWSGVDSSKAHLFSRLTSVGSSLEAFILFITWTLSGTACDVLIAFFMCRYLRKRAQGTQTRSTQRFVAGVVRMTIETGSLTALISVVSLIFFFTPALGSLNWVVPLSSIAKLYSTTMLCSLNSRIYLTRGGSNIISSSIELQHTSRSASTLVPLPNTHRTIQDTNGVHKSVAITVQCDDI